MTSKPANTFSRKKNSSVASSLFKLCERRQGIAGVKGNQLQLLTDSDDVMQALIRDIQLARHNIEMVFLHLAARRHGGSGRLNR
ncbi:cardiolipin synthetase [Salmonella enterica subsp. enterica]|uniref:Cardiolipin synthetase n=1 Tax=Salmonella enterica I TaxID=59201 RepID=A0A447U288_SALET|nr:cardiolipin synthetase [Salmonella enterica subsp. enterica]